MKPRVTSFAPQFLVDDLERSIAYYQKLGFTFGEPWEGFYAIGYLDGLELHLKEAPKDEGERRHRRGKEDLHGATRRCSRRGRQRGLLPAVRRQRCHHSEAARTYRVGHAGFLRGRPRRLHHL